VSSPALESTLPTKADFMPEKLRAVFGIAHLHFDNYIMSKINDVAYYFQPVASKFEKRACETEASELKEHKQMTLRTFHTALQWLSERRISAQWTPLLKSSELELKSSI